MTLKSHEGGVVAGARGFAVEVHGGQKYGDRPYVVHLDAVAEVALPFGEEAQVIAYLHDVAEDTSTGLEEIKERFGERVARCVGLLTDPKGATRKERKVLSHAKLAKVGAEDGVALIVKAADRLANLRESAKGGRNLETYRQEHAAFRAAVYREGLCEGIWREIEGIIRG